MPISEGLQDQLKAAAILGAFAWVFNSIGDLKHKQDLHISESGQRLNQAEAERRDLWDRENEEERNEKEEIREEGRAFLELMERVHEGQLGQKDAEIQRLKRELDEKR